MNNALADAHSIDGVLLQPLQIHGDQRGRVFEGWRAEWTPFSVKQMTEARAETGVVKGLHLHYRQWDWWRCVSGRMLVGLYDARPDSPTRGTAVNFEMNSEAPTGLAIPPGVAHGFRAKTDLEMVYLLSEMYDPSDEHGIKWDSVGLDWGISDPTLSQRDIDLPPLDQFVWQD